jgi:ATP synthase I chain
MEAAKGIDEAALERAERRIERLTLLLGAGGALVATLAASWRWGAGVLVGAALAWLNFRWLQSGLDALKHVSVEQAGAAKARVPMWTWIKFAGRYVLIGLCVYVIFVGFRVPIVSMLAGLCALGAAAMAASLYEVARPAG